MKIVNLTPHQIDFPNQGISIPPEKTPARVSVTTTFVTHIAGIPVTKNEYGDVEGLPEPQAGTIYIVSLMVAQRVPLRADVFVVNGAIRDEKGRIIGASSIA